MTLRYPKTWPKVKVSKKTIVTLTYLIPGLIYLTLNAEVTRSVAQQAADNAIYFETPSTPLALVKKQLMANLPANYQPGYKPSAKESLGMITREAQRATPKDITAVLHIGPIKTRSTAITSIFPLFRDVLPQDNYELANYNWMRDHNLDPINFVACFKNEEYSESRRLRAKVDQNHRHLTEVLDMECHEETLRATLDIAKRGHNMLISAETLPIPQRDVKALREFLRPWKNVEVVAFYRRYFDWLISFENRSQKERKVPKRIPFVDVLKQKMMSTEDPLDGWYTVGSVNRFKEHFDNVKVYNMHNIPNGDSREEFFCKALPNAPNTCREFKAQREAGEIDSFNPMVPLVYEHLAYYAKEMHLWSDRYGVTMKSAALGAKKHQETVLGLSPYDFEGKVCPDDETINWLKKKSWEAEYLLFPEYFQKQGKQEIAAEIEKIRYTKLCHIDAKETLKDPKWQQFFKEL